MCIIYSDVRNELSNIIVDEQTEQKILKTTSYDIIKKAVDRYNNNIKICNKLRTRVNLLHICLEKRYFSILEFYTIQEVYNLFVEHDIKEQKKVLEILDGLENLLSEITGYSYDYLGFMLSYSYYLWCGDVEFLELEYYLRENSVPSYIVDMVTELLDGKPYVLFDGGNWWAYSEEDMKEEAEYYFKDLELDDIYTIYKEC